MSGILELQAPNSPFMGFFGDVHGEVGLMKALMALHKDVTWYSTGDIVDMFDPKHNNDAVTALGNIPTTRGNHEEVAVNNLLGDIHICFQIAAWPKGIRIIHPLGNLLMFHSKPATAWEFVEKGYTEREFVDDFPTEENAKAIIIGHNHQCFIKRFPYVTTELWSIGSLRYGKKYMLVNTETLEPVFKTL